MYPFKYQNLTGFHLRNAISYFHDKQKIMPRRSNIWAHKSNKSL